MEGKKKYIYWVLTQLYFILMLMLMNNKTKLCYCENYLWNKRLGVLVTRVSAETNVIPIML